MHNKGNIESDKPLPIGDHLKELRNRLFKCVIFYVVAFLVCLNFANKIVEVMTDMGTKYGYQYVYIAPQELLMVYFGMAMIGGLVISMPVLVYEFYEFAKPGLSKKEQTAIKWCLLFGFVCFGIGVLFAYKISVPFMLEFLIKFSFDSVISASISIREFTSFLLTVFVIFGVIFELPVVSVLLTCIGILKAEYMIKLRKVMYVVIFFVAAVVTPPDVVSQVMVAIPMVILYEISIWLSKLFSKKTHE